MFLRRFHTSLRLIEASVYFLLVRAEMFASPPQEKYPDWRMHWKLPNFYQPSLSPTETIFRLAELVYRPQD